MEEKYIFREMLSELKELAAEKGNSLSAREVREFFGKVPLEEEHYSLIYDYLAGQKIQVIREDGSVVARAGVRPEEQSEKEDQPEEDGQPAGRAESLALYLEELERLDGSGEERIALFDRAASGDAAAKKELIEQYLLTVCQMAEEYESEAVLTEDLIQEGNMGLVMAVEELEPMDSLAAYEAYLMNEISKSLEAVSNENQDRRDLGENMVSRVNQLNQAIHSLEEELEHKVSVEELSAYLEMPAEEIRSVLRMAGDEIEVEGK